MKSLLAAAIAVRSSLFLYTPSHGVTPLSSKNRNFLKPSKSNPSLLSLTSQSNHLPLFIALCSKSSVSGNSNLNCSSESAEGSRGTLVDDESESQWTVEVGNPSVYVPAVAKLSLSDQAFFLLAFIACTTSLAFTSLVVAAVPTLYAMGRAATSLSKLADTAREELPSTMAAIRLSGMEISDLTLELSDMSKEITDGVNKSAQAVQAAEAGIRQIGSHARQQTISMIQERANLPIISLQPVVAGAAKKTSRAVGQATRTFLNMITRGEFSPEDEDDFGIDRVEV